MLGYFVSQTFTTIIIIILIKSIIIIIIIIRILEITNQGVLI